MYERSAEGWAKHLDFILLDMICLEISLALAYILRHGIYNPFTADSYRNLSIVVLFLDFALLLFCLLCSRLKCADTLAPNSSISKGLTI